MNRFVNSNEIAMNAIDIRTIHFNSLCSMCITNKTECVFRVTGRTVGSNWMVEAAKALGQEVVLGIFFTVQKR